MVNELHVIVKREPSGAYVSSVSGIPGLAVRADNMEALRAKTLEMVRDNADTLESGMGSRLERTTLSKDD